MIAVLFRGAVAMALGLSLILGSMGAGSSASAEGPASVFYGYVFADAEGTLPERVQALGPAGAVCGSADIVRVSDSAGFYVLAAVTASSKRGCPPQNSAVQFSLLSGRLDDGNWAEQMATLVEREAPQLLNLSAARRMLPNWLGTPGNVDGRGSLLRWAGEATSLPEALAALPFPTGAVYRLDPVSGLFVDVTLASDVTIKPSDLVLVRFR